MARLHQEEFGDVKSTPAPSSSSHLPSGTSTTSVASDVVSPDTKKTKGTSSGAATEETSPSPPGKQLSETPDPASGDDKKTEEVEESLENEESQEEEKESLENEGSLEEEKEDTPTDKTSEENSSQEGEAVDAPDDSDVNSKDDDIASKTNASDLCKDESDKPETLNVTNGGQSKNGTAEDKPSDENAVP